MRKFQHHGRKVGQQRGRDEAFHEGVGFRPMHPVAFHTHHVPPVYTGLGGSSAGAETAFNKTDVTGGSLSIGTPLSGPQSHGRFRRMGKKRGF